MSANKSNEIGSMWTIKKQFDPPFNNQTNINPIFKTKATPNEHSSNNNIELIFPSQRDTREENQLSTLEYRHQNIAGDPLRNHVDFDHLERSFLEKKNNISSPRTALLQQSELQPQGRGYDQVPQAGGYESSYSCACCPDSGGGLFGSESLPLLLSLGTLGLLVFYILMQALLAPVPVPAIPRRRRRKRRDIFNEQHHQQANHIIEGIHAKRMEYESPVLDESHSVPAVNYQRNEGNYLLSKSASYGMAKDRSARKNTSGVVMRLKGSKALLSTATAAFEKRKSSRQMLIGGRKHRQKWSSTENNDNRDGNNSNESVIDRRDDSNALWTNATLLQNDVERLKKYSAIHQPDNNTTLKKNDKQGMAVLPPHDDFNNNDIVDYHRKLFEQKYEFDENKKNEVYQQTPYSYSNNDEEQMSGSVMAPSGHECRLHLWRCLTKSAEDAVPYLDSIQLPRFLLSFVLHGGLFHRPEMIPLIRKLLLCVTTFKSCQRLTIRKQQQQWSSPVPPPAITIEPDDIENEI